MCLIGSHFSSSSSCACHVAKVKWEMCAQCKSRGVLLPLRDCIGIPRDAMKERICHENVIHFSAR